jgi:hypothetical protein
MLNDGKIYTQLNEKRQGLDMDFKGKDMIMCTDFIPLHGEKLYYLESFSICASHSI